MPKSSNPPSIERLEFHKNKIRQGLDYRDGFTKALPKKGQRRCPACACSAMFFGLALNDQTPASVNVGCFRFIFDEHYTDLLSPQIGRVTRKFADQNKKGIVRQNEGAVATFRYPGIIA